MLTISFNLPFDLLKWLLKHRRNMWRWKSLKLRWLLVNMLNWNEYLNQWRPNYYWYQSSSLLIIWTRSCWRSWMLRLEKRILYFMNVLVLDDDCLRIHQCFCFARPRNLSSWVGCKHSLKLKSRELESNSRSNLGRTQLRSWDQWERGRTQTRRLQTRRHQQSNNQIWIQTQPSWLWRRSERYWSRSIENINQSTWINYRCP